MYKEGSQLRASLENLVQHPGDNITIILEGTSEECLEIKTTMKASRAMLRILISGDNGFNEELYR